MTIPLRLAAVTVLTALVSAGCLDFNPPPVVEGTPTRTPTATWTPEPTPTVPTPTPTSTSTPEPTATGTPTPFNPFAPTTGVGTLPSGFDLVTPAAGLGTPFPPGGATTGTLIGATLPSSSTLLPPVGAAASAPTPSPVLPPLEPTMPPATSWDCNGDERMQFVPEAPVVNDELLITVTSANDHGEFLLFGPPGLEMSKRGRGGPGYFWQWKRRMDKPGLFTFEFYAGPRPESRCVTGEVRVTAGGPPPTPTPVPAQIPTPTPTRTPRPDH